MTRPLVAATSLALLLALPTACAELETDAGPTADVTEDASADVEDDVGLFEPGVPFTLDCAGCHDLAALQVVVPSDGAAPRDHLLAVDAIGLVRTDLAIPTAGLHFALPWPKRGRHTEGDVASCSGCHPVDEVGVGHTLSVYPTAQVAFASGGRDCAGSCHGWLPEAASVDGFAPATGAAPSFSGSLRPAALLAGVETAHTALWRSGARPEVAGDAHIAAFNAGCGGCHNVAAEAHGT
ncbi:MAG: hypothetical protein EP329_21730, partial [Deltaproteobacteria bacterium]